MRSTFLLNPYNKGRIKAMVRNSVQDRVTGRVRGKDQTLVQLRA
jgi:hypothetical protein